MTPEQRKEQMSKMTPEQRKRLLTKMIVRAVGTLDQDREAQKDEDVLQAVARIVRKILAIRTEFPAANEDFIVACLAYKNGLVGRLDVAATKLGPLSLLGIQAKNPRGWKIGKRLAKKLCSLKVSYENLDAAEDASKAEEIGKAFVSKRIGQ